MRIYRLNFLLILLSVTFISAAQLRQEEISVAFGEKMKDAGPVNIVGGDEDGGVFILRHKRKSSWPGRREKTVQLLQKYDREMNLVKSKELSIDLQKPHLNIEYIMQVKKRILLFAHENKNDFKEESLVVQEVNSESLLPEGGLKNILKIPSSEGSGYFHFCTSPDKTKTLVMYKTPESHGRSGLLKLFVLDENMEIAWSKDSGVSGKGKIFSPEKSLVDNKGNVYILNTVFREKRKTKRDGKPDYRYHLITYKKSGTEVNEYSIQHRDKFLTDIQIAVNEEEDITGGGFYSENGSWHIQGSYFFKIDGKTNELSAKDLKEFPENFLIQDLPYLVKGGKTPVALKLHNYRLSDIMLRKDGSALLVGEEYLVTTHTKITRKWNSGVKSKTSYHYAYGDILLVNVKENGEISLIDKIKKKQHSVNDAGLFSSFALSVKDGNAYFVFNDFSENEIKKWEKAAFSKEGPVPVLVKVDKEGNQIRSEISSIEEKRVAVLPKTGISTGPSEFVFTGKGKKRDRIVRLKVNSKGAFLAVKE